MHDGLQELDLLDQMFMKLVVSTQKGQEGFLNATGKLHLATVWLVTYLLLILLNFYNLKIEIDH